MEEENPLRDNSNIGTRFCTICGGEVIRANFIDTDMATKSITIPTSHRICECKFPDMAQNQALSLNQEPSLLQNSRVNLAEGPQVLTPQVLMPSDPPTDEGAAPMDINETDGTHAKHNDTFNIKCPLCDTRFSSESKLKDHIKTHQYSEFRHKCSICLRRFLLRDEVRMHVRTHIDSAKGSCTACGVRIKNRTLLVRHMYIHTVIEAGDAQTKNQQAPPTQKVESETSVDTGSENPLSMEVETTDNGSESVGYKCNVCRLTFSSELELKQHTQTHQQSKCKHKCSICSERFLLLKDARQHVRTHVDKAKMRCMACDTALNSFWLIRHMYEHIEYEINEIQVKQEPLLIPKEEGGATPPSASPSASLSHDSSSVDDGFTNSLGVMGKTTVDFKCRLCDKFFISKLKLKEHIESHKILEIRHRCSICSKGFLLKSEVKIHVRTHIDNSNFSCGPCGVRIKRIDILNSHMAKHIEVETNYRCGVCYEIFKDYNKFDEHITLTHLETEKQQCKFCFKEYSPDYIKMHLQTHKETDYRCQKCWSYFRNQADLEEHMKKHVIERPFKCDYCEWSFPNQNGLRVHMYVHSKDKPHKCKYCPKSFTTRWKVESHMMNHTGEKKFKCDLCYKSYNCKTSLKRHTGTHLRPSQKPVREVVCAICQLILGDDVYTHHLMTHKHPGCKECDETFYLKEAFRKHLTSHEPKKIPCQICDVQCTSDYNYKLHMESHTCQFCKMLFTSKEDLVKHLVVHEEREVVCGICQKVSPSEYDHSVHVQSHECQFCKKLCRSNEELKEHLQDHEEKRVQCSICFLTFQSVHELNIHMDTHTCHVCKKRFVSQDRLKEHVKLHEEKKVECDHCDHIFISEHELKCHKKILEKEKRHICQHCGVKFAYRVELNRHVDWHHPTTPMELKCEICSEVLSNVPDFEKHRLTKHNLTNQCPKCPRVFSSVLYLQAHMKNHEK